MSRTAPTVLLVIAGAVIVALIEMLTVDGGMMGGMMRGMGGMTACLMWIFGWVIDVGLIALLIETRACYQL